MRASNHLDEHLLRHFFGEAPIGKEPARKPKQGRGVAFEKLPGSLRIAAADTFEERAILARPVLSGSVSDRHGNLSDVRRFQRFRAHGPRREPWKTVSPLGFPHAVPAIAYPGYSPAWMESAAFKIVDFAIQLAVILFSISFHESAHAWSALQFGDTTARDLGRISLNPIRHIDPFGSIILPLVLYIFSGFIFGAAKPTPVDLRNTRDPRLASLVVSAAGPLSNFLLAGAGVVLLRLVRVLSPESIGELLQALQGRHFASGTLAPITYLLFQFSIVNVALGVFNLIPIPPLDGSGVVAAAVGAPAQRVFALLAPFGFLILIMLMTTRLLGWIFAPFQRLLLGLVFGA